MADDDADTAAGTNAPEDAAPARRTRDIGSAEPTPEELDQRQDEMGAVRKQDGPDLPVSRDIGGPPDVPETDVPIVPDED